MDFEPSIWEFYALFFFLLLLSCMSEVTFKNIKQSYNNQKGLRCAIIAGHFLQCFITVLAFWSSQWTLEVSSLVPFYRPRD